MAGTDTRTVKVNLTADPSSLKAAMASAKTSTTAYQSQVKAAQRQLDAMVAAHKRAKLPPLKAGTEGYDRAIRQARAEVDKLAAAEKRQRAELERTTKAQEQAQKRAERWQTVGRVAQVAGVAVAAGLWKATQAASDLSESVSKSGVVFGDAADGVQAWSTTAAEAFGQSQRQALEAAGTFGNLFVSMGFATGESAEMSTSLVELAGDLASFNNIDPTEALDALRSGLVGETEPMRRLGVNMNEATLRAEALALGLDATTATLSPAVKAQAAYSLIMKQTATAQGDFARTADGLANSQRIARAQFEDATAALGQALTPAVTQAAKAVSGLLAWFNDLPGPVRTAVTWFTAAGAAALLLAPKLTAVASAVKSIDAAVKASALGGAAGAGTLAGGLSAIVGVAAGGTLALHKIGEKVHEVTGLSRDLIAVLANFPVNVIAPGAGTAVEGLLVQLGLLHDRFANFPETWQTNAAEFQGFMDRLEAGEGDVQLFAKGLHEGKTAADAFNDALSSGAGAAAFGLGGVATAAGQVAAQFASAAEKARALRGELQTLLGLNRAMMGSQDALIGMEDRLAAARRKNGSHLRGNTRAAIANREAMGQEVDNITALAQATYDRVKASQGEAAAQKAANRVIRNHVQDLRDAAKAAGLSGREVGWYVARLMSIPRHRRTDITATVNWKHVGIGAIGPVGVPTGATGGLVHGPGGVDNVPAWLTSGEYVLRRSAVARVGVDRLDAVNFAGGGRVPGGTPSRPTGRPGITGTPWGRAAIRRSTAAPANAKQIVEVNRAARDTAVDKWRDRVAGAAAALADLRSQADATRKAIVDHVTGSFRLLDGLDLAGHEQALRGVEQAQEQVAAAARDAAAAQQDATAAQQDATAAAARYRVAQIQINRATPGDRAQAVKDLADAERELTDARAAAAAARLEVAAADGTAAAARRDATAAQQAAAKAAPTAAGVIKNLQDQRKAAEHYAAGVSRLVKRGLNRDLIDQLVGSDPAQAKDMLQVLSSMTAAQLAQVNAAQQATRAAGAILGRNVTGPRFAAGLAAAEQQLTLTRRQQPATVAEQLATQALTRQQQRLAAARAANGATLRHGSIAAERNREALKLEANLIKTAAVEIYNRVKATQGEATAQKVANAYVAQHSRDLINAASAAGYNAGAVRTLVDGLGLLPGDVRIDYTAPGLAESVVAVDDLGRLIAGLPLTRSVGIITIGHDAAEERLGRVRDSVTAIPTSRNTHTTTTGTPTVVDDTTRVRNAVNTIPASRNTALTVSGVPAVGAAIKDAQGRVNQLKGRNVNIGTQGVYGSGPAGVYGQVNDAQKKVNAFTGKTVSLAVELNQQAYRATMDAIRAAIRLMRKANALRKGAFAAGGLIPGPPSTADTVTARVSTGEYIVQARAVQRLGVARMDEINRGRLPGYATGGPVAARPAATAAPVVITGGVPVVLQLDSREMWRGQLDLRRRSGNTWQLVSQ